MGMRSDPSLLPSVTCFNFSRELLFLLLLRTFAQYVFALVLTS